MTYFKLDIPKINECISIYNDVKNNCLEDIGTVYNGLGYTESAWNDQNAYIFIEKTKSDKYKVNEYFEYLNSLYDEINQFKTDVDNICSKQGYRRNTVTLKFDDSDIDEVKKYLDNAKYYLNDSLNRISFSDFGIDLECIKLVYNLRNEIKSVKNSINEIIEDINSFVSSINDEIADSKFRLKRISNYDFGLKTIEYKWNITDFDVKKVNTIDLETFSSIPQASISNNIKQVNLSQNTYSNVSVNEINIKETELIKGINNNLSVTNGQVKDIELKENENIQDLNKNLNANVASQNDINFDETELIKGINNNLDIVATANANIENIDVSQIQGLKANISESSVVNNNVSFETVRPVNNLNNNLEAAKVNNNTINYNINSNVNIADNITEANVTKTNIDTSNIVSKNYDLSSGINVADLNEVKITSNINEKVDLDININKMESLSDSSDK